MCQYTIGIKPLTYQNFEWFAIRNAKIVRLRKGANITISITQISKNVTLFVANGSRLEIATASKNESSNTTYTIDGYLASEDLGEHRL